MVRVPATTGENAKPVTPAGAWQDVDVLEPFPPAVALPFRPTVFHPPLSRLTGVAR